MHIPLFQDSVLNVYFEFDLIKYNIFILCAACNNMNVKEIILSHKTVKWDFFTTGLHELNTLDKTNINKHCL